MDTTHFENERRSNVVAEINTKALPAGATAAEHSYPFEVRAPVLERQIASTVAGDKRTYAKGDVYTMAADCRHAEEVGAEGVSYVVGRRRNPVG